MMMIIIRIMTRNNDYDDDDDNFNDNDNYKYDDIKYQDDDNNYCSSVQTPRQLTVSRNLDIDFLNLLFSFIFFQIKI